jgi:flagellar motor switch protein FliG
LSGQGTSLDGLQKAAIVLVSLGTAESASVLRHMPEEDANTLAQAVAKLDRVENDQAQAVLQEFTRLAASQQLYLKGGMEYASKMLNEAYGADVAQSLLDRLSKSAKEGFNFESFRKADPQQLAKLIQDEHPQTIALILSHFNPSQAATLLSSLPPETRTDVAIRIADMEQISPEIVRNIAVVIDNKLRNLGELSREACGGVRAIANIFNRLDPLTCAQLMSAIEQNKPPLLENIKRFMFVFRDLENLDASSITALLSRANRSSLIVALKGANESLRQKVIGTQSQRGAQMMTEEIESLGPVRLRDVDAAQQEIIALAREMEKEGVLSLQGSSDEQYVY